MNRLRSRWAVAASLGAAAILLSGCSGSTVVGSDEKVPSITARGMGEVTGTPDTVVITLGVETEGDEASDALSRNNQSSDAVIAELKRTGVADEDIKTSQFSINPRYDDEGRSITGYMVTNLVTARMSTDQDAGALIDAAAEAAGNDIRVQSVSFEIDDEGELYARARADAVERARQQAEQLANAAGVALGPVRSIIESSTTPGFPMPLTDVRESANLFPGTQELTLEVEVVYEID